MSAKKNSSKQMRVVVCRPKRKPEVVVLKSQEEWDELLDAEILDGWGENRLCDDEFCLLSEFAVRVNSHLAFREPREHEVGTSVAYGTAIILRSKANIGKESAWCGKSLSVEDAAIVLRALDHAKRVGK